MKKSRRILKKILFLFIIAGLAILLATCSPGREDQGLSPVIYVSGTAQQRLARTLLSRTRESIRLVESLQRGYALPTPRQDTTRLRPADSSYYVYMQGTPDTLKEMVRFVPNIWLHPGTRADSVFYRWEVTGGDTSSHGIYAYRIASKRLPYDTLAHDSLARLTGTVSYAQRFYQNGGDGYIYDYSYGFVGTFNEPGGAPPPLAGATYRWSGTEITWESDGIPSQWTLTGDSQRSGDGSWNIVFTMDGDIFVRATLDSLGVGTFRIGWDNFGQVYTYTP